MNITLSAEGSIIEAARTWALDHGTSLNNLVRDYLASLGSVMDREEAARLFAANATKFPGHSRSDRPFCREELYQGRRFGDADPGQDASGQVS